MRKMFVRADDVGYTKVFNIGAFEALTDGIATSADVMLDCPGTEDALLRLREMPWISVGWHIHLWGAPILSADRVSTLIEQDGEFKGRFRTDIRSAADVDAGQLKDELRAELTRCVDILGRAPVSCDVGPADSPFSRIVIGLCDEFGIAYHFQTKKGTDPRVRDIVYESRKSDPNWVKKFEDGSAFADALPDEKWKDRHILMFDGQFAYKDLYTDSIASVENSYDPARYYIEDRPGILALDEEIICGQAWHPGCVDYYVYRQGERANRPRAQQFVICRTQDAHALCSEALKSWVIDNRIELVSIGDAIYGKSDYQNHLRAIGSALAVSH